MRPHELEGWVLQVLERIDRKQPIEDARIELKAKWPDPQDAARRIAGHANAARGAQVLWLIGADEVGGAAGASASGFASWWAQVQSHFDGPAPNPFDLNVVAPNGSTVVAILFDVERVPFVVKNPVHGIKGGGPVSHEVPWREGTATRTARRSDLIKLLVPLEHLPEIEPLSAELIAQRSTLNTSPPQTLVHWFLEVALYVEPASSARVVVPCHRCEGFAQFPDGPRLIFTDFNFAMKDSIDESLVSCSTTEAMFAVPGMVEVHATSPGIELDAPPDGAPVLDLQLRPSRSEIGIPISIQLTRITRPPGGYWASWGYGNWRRLGGDEYANWLQEVVDRLNQSPSSTVSVDAATHAFAARAVAEGRLTWTPDSRGVVLPGFHRS
jgi:hypothetical protein